MSLTISGWMPWRIVEGHDLGERDALALRLVGLRHLLDYTGAALERLGILLGLAVRDLTDYGNVLLELPVARVRVCCSINSASGSSIFRSFISRRVLRITRRAR